MGRHSASSAPAGAPTLEWAPVGPTHRPRHASSTPAAPFRVPAEHGNLALDFHRADIEPTSAPAPPPTLTLVPPTEAPHTPAHHGAPAPLPMRVLADVVGWAGFAVGVVWVVIVSSGHGVAGASAWAASLFGLIAAAVALLVLTSRPVRTTAATPAHRPSELDRTRV
jgi:hypothetical protein